MAGPSFVQAWLNEFKTGRALGIIELSGNVFNTVVRKDLLFRALQYENSLAEAGTMSSKALGQVRGTTRKPFQQKGRGRARHGTLRAPQYRKVYDQAMRSALSAKFAQNQLFVVDNYEDVTKESLEESLKALGLWGRKTYCLHGRSQVPVGLIRTANVIRNDSTKEPKVRKMLVSSTQHMLVQPLMQYEIIIADKAAVEDLEEEYATD
ncbi:hypothetical protein HDU96_007642 [Phlyctochytrium bullatum]|nr:hypothetical protein HDU96_007642 [Phlyctochytrium bullatum]